MTYGLIASSLGGIPVLHADFEALQSGDERSLPRSTTIPHDTGGQWSAYDFIPALLIKMAVGDWVGVTHYGTRYCYISNRTSLVVREANLAGDLPNPAGYGAVTYNSSGRKTWVASSPVMVVSAFHEVEGGVVASGSDWILPTTTRATWNVSVQDRSVFRIHAVRRVATTTYDIHPVIISQVPGQRNEVVFSHTRFFTAG